MISKIAIVGSGFGMYCLLPAFSRVKDCKIVGISGKNSERMTEFCKKFDVKHYSNWKEMIVQEKPDGDSGWINGGFFVLDPSVLDLINGDDCSWEHEPLSQLASNNQLSAYLHEGFWQPMDTIRDKQRLEELWASGNAPWKNWDR